MVFFMAFGAFRRGNALIYMRLKFPLMFEWEIRRPTPAGVAKHQNIAKPALLRAFLCLRPASAAAEGLGKHELFMR